MHRYKTATFLAFEFSSGMGMTGIPLAWKVMLWVSHRDWNKCHGKKAVEGCLLSFNWYGLYFAISPL